MAYYNYLSDFPGLLQGGGASFKETKPLTGNQRQDLLKRAGPQGGGPLTGRPALSQKAGPLLGIPGLSQGGRASPREAGPLIGRQGLSQSALKILPKILIQTYISEGVLPSIIRKLQHFILCKKKHGENVYLVGLTKFFWPRNTGPAFHRFLIAWLPMHCVKTIEERSLRICKHCWQYYQQIW